MNWYRTGAFKTLPPFLSQSLSATAKTQTLKWHFFSTSLYFFLDFRDAYSSYTHVNSKYSYLFARMKGVSWCAKQTETNYCYSCFQIFSVSSVIASWKHLPLRVEVHWDRTVCSTLNALNQLKDRFIDIAADGKISEDELMDFNNIKNKLEQISLTADTLRFWMEQHIIWHRLAMRCSLLDVHCFWWLVNIYPLTLNDHNYYYSLSK